MGNTLSIREVRDEGYYHGYGPISTDSPTSTPSKVLDEFVDPRSPTAGIDRTPIQLAATPRPVKDPRSPTVGIERTPIVEGI